MSISDPVRVVDNSAIGGASAANQVITNTYLADIRAAFRASAANVTSVDDTAENVTLLAENTDRAGVIIHNDSDQVLYVKYGATATTTDFTVAIGVGAIWSMPWPIYTGQVDGIWAANSNGAARITELTA